MTGRIVGRTGVRTGETTAPIAAMTGVMIVATIIAAPAASSMPMIITGPTAAMATAIGPTGLIIGAALGGLIGNQVGRGQSNTAGLLIGGGAGALLGREIDRGGMSCR